MEQRQKWNMDAKDRKEVTDNEIKIVCVWCNAPWTAHMSDDLYVSGGCPSCGDYENITGTIDIRCDNCGRIVYTKEYGS